MRNLRDAPNVSAIELWNAWSSDHGEVNGQRWSGMRAKGIGMRVPRARLRPRLRRTDSPSSR